jgi:hypothetical protein
VQLLVGHARSYRGGRVHQHLACLEIEARAVDRHGRLELQPEIDDSPHGAKRRVACRPARSAERPTVRYDDRGSHAPGRDGGRHRCLPRPQRYHSALVLRWTQRRHRPAGQGCRTGRCHNGAAVSRAVRRRPLGISATRRYRSCPGTEGFPWALRRSQRGIATHRSRNRCGRQPLWSRGGRRRDHRSAAPTDNTGPYPSLSLRSRGDDRGSPVRHLSHRRRCDRRWRRYRVGAEDGIRRLDQGNRSTRTCYPSLGSGGARGRRIGPRMGRITAGTDRTRRASRSFGCNQGLAMGHRDGGDRVDIRPRRPARRFHRAAAEVYRRAPRRDPADAAALEAVIAAIRRPGGAGRM